MCRVHAQTGAATPVRVTHSRHTAATCKTLTYNQTLNHQSTSDTLLIEYHDEYCCCLVAKSCLTLLRLHGL